MSTCPDEAVSRPVGQVVVPHLRVLADVGELLLVQPESGAAADLVLHAEGGPGGSHRVGRHAEHVLAARLEGPRVVAVAVVRVADRQRERLQLAPRRVGVERGPVVGIEIGTAGGRRRHARIVGDVLRDARRRHVIGVGVIAEARAEPPVGGSGEESAVGCDVRFRFVENTCASASALARGSAIGASAELIVNGCSGSSLLHRP